MSSVNLPITGTITLNNGQITGTYTATTTPVATVPSAPVNVSVAAGVQQAVVTFGTPSSNGGASITGYTVVASSGQSVSNATSPITVTGLTAGTPVSFTVAATNSVGLGLSSAPTVPVVPLSPPPAPTTTWVYYNGTMNWAGDRSYAATINYKDTAGVPISGSYDVAVTATTWGAWQPYPTGNTFSMNAFPTFTVAIKPTLAGSKWQMYCTIAGGATQGTMVNLMSYGPAPIVGQWGVYNVPVSAFGVASGSISMFAIQDASGMANNVWYVDNVGFTSIPAPSPTPPPSPTPSPTPPPSPTPSPTPPPSPSPTPPPSPTPAPTPPPVATGGYDGTIKIGSGANSNRFVNGSGQVIQLRGLNMSGLETTAVHGWTADCWGDDGGEPNWTAYQTWKPNVARIPLNAGSFLGLTTFNTTGAEGNPVWGTSIKCDPYGTYKAAIINTVNKLRSINCYIIFDLHWCAPKITLGGVSNYLSPLGQSSFADADTGLVFWQQFVPWLKAQFPGGINDIMFELFNEPFLSSVGATYSVGDPDVALLQGGTSNMLINSSQNGTNYKITATWNLAGYQQMLAAIRSAGANNICIVNGNVWSQQLQNFKTWAPTDTLTPAQVAFGCHPYPNGQYPYSNGNVYPSIGSDAGSGTAQSTQWFTNCMNLGYPVIFTEDGGEGGTAATATPNAEPHMAFMQNYADSMGISYVAWQWNNTQVYNTSSVQNYATVYAADGKTITPILGEGTQTYNWMVNHK